MILFASTAPEPPGAESPSNAICGFLAAVILAWCVWQFIKKGGRS